MTLELACDVAERDVGVAFEVATGETLAVLGPNGSGKSTVLGVAAGLVAPDTGRVVLEGRVLTDVGPGRPGLLVPPHDRRTALLGQDPLLFPHLDALENVAFGPRSAGAGRSAARRSAQRWLDEVGVGELAHRRPAQLSGGQAQRVAVARALAAAPALLLLDEPMSALDVAVLPALRQTLRRVLAGRSAVLVTHDPLDALLLADRVVVLSEGRVVEQGVATEVLSRPRSPFAARLAGLNLVSGTWRDGCVEAPDGLRVHGQVEGGPLAQGEAAIATFRPAAVAVYRDPVEGSPRNELTVTVSELEPLADLVRVHAGPLHADVTVQAAAELELAAGQVVRFVVKATEVSVYSRS
ncbi:MAG TPA: ATP-binding cassette domain-containing protein [Nocardioides sp.]|uniref:sulfate/molybdate ABC transporter ATP-binding protein n=1 Tax=Nocardioides sp. TaxID=35761 RepID=UPI002E2F745C|nr:ATP-binding cassette domain-containing protein [Nocardioides sp.]HEX5089955.1 ATP-binding cassette domain-containing protein [Nocardioides sp.]